MEFNTDLLKNIWLKHIEVQERVLQLNSAPIIVEPESIQISGQKLSAKVCQTDELDSKLNRIKSFFNITDEFIDHDNDTIICDSNYDIDSSALYNLAHNFISHFAFRIISGINPESPN